MLPFNVVKKVREGFLEKVMKSEEPHKRQPDGEEKEAYSGRGNHRLKNSVMGANKAISRE